MLYSINKVVTPTLFRPPCLYRYMSSCKSVGYTSILQCGFWLSIQPSPATLQAFDASPRLTDQSASPPNTPGGTQHMARSTIVYANQCTVRNTVQRRFLYRLVRLGNASGFDNQACTVVYNGISSSVMLFQTQICAKSTVLVTPESYAVRNVLSSSVIR